MTLTWTDLISLDLGKLNEAVAEWKTAAEELAKLHATVRDGLVKKSEAARWEGVNATVTREFVRSAAKEVDDLQREAKSIHLILADAHAELTQIQKQAKALADEARQGDPSHTPEPDPGLLVSDGGGGKVRVESSICDAKGPNQRTQDMVRWYAETLTGLVSHASEVDAAVTRALRASHGADPYNAGHAEYTSLDQDQLPRAMKLAALGKDAKPAQQAELRRLWQSLSPDARAQLWTAHRDDLLAAGLFNPSVKRAAPDRGSGKHGAEDIEWNDWVTRTKMQALVVLADSGDLNDASRHMKHYLDNTGTPMELPVDKMLTDNRGFQAHVDQLFLQGNEKEWREQALAEYERNGGRPVVIPVETPNEGYYFGDAADPNWYYAVGGAQSNVTGVVTVMPGADGKPVVGLDYQVNVWDRYNWDQGKGVHIGKLEIPDGEPSQQHRVGLAQEFNMAGSSSVKHYELGSAAAVPAPDEPGRAGERSDPGRHARDGGGDIDR
ncbi:hypothetical protein [Streptomyces sp. NBC_01205]|uniref:hypothetical protein n=1 Tax=Streptomyces sp. NBC_01205 TaxID=2903771 RepID=UPI002E164E26|nr:hypothetical protein OG573_42660 [Streptomyces sp. NBC_01205]